MAEHQRAEVPVRAKRPRARQYAHIPMSYKEGNLDVSEEDDEYDEAFLNSRVQQETPHQES